MRALWLPDVLRAAGLKVSTVAGWETRGRDMGTIEGVVAHHTAGPASGNAPSLNIVTNGRSDLPGPLSCAVLARDGTWIIVAAGRANHAGVGTWNGITDGNGRFLGVEAEATGTSTWPKVQYDSYVRGVAAILRRIGKPSMWVAGHKEYATPRGRKPDPNFDMAPFRAAVGRLLAGNPPTPSEDRMFDRQPGEIVHLIARIDGHLLDLPEEGGVNGAPVLTYPSDGGVDQRWRIDRHGDACDILTNRGTLALDAKSRDPKPDDPVQVWAPHGGPEQRWQIKPLPSADNLIVHHATGLVLEVIPGAPGKVVLAEEEAGNLGQLFQLAASV